MGLITYALLVIGGWIAAFGIASETIKEDISGKRAAYKDRGRYSHLTNPDDEEYPWVELAAKTALMGFIWMVLAILFAFFWKTTWFAAICAVLYWKVTWVRIKADAAWARIKSLKASLEAKLRG